MTYELAKELYDAGFRVPEGPGTQYAYKEIGENNYAVVMPSLSELIAACNPTDNYCILLNITKSISTASRGSEVGSGNTPEIAVANLWLSLNKKSP